jgi:transcriptional regulator of arginine metabolism
MTRNKQARQQAIKQLITDQQIKKQEDLVTLLNEQGWDVTQATISRDIASMQLVKIPTETGGFMYAMMSGADYLSQLANIMHEPTTKVASQDNMVMISVAPGTGPALKAAIEEVHFGEIFGVIGDDASALVVLHSASKGVDFSAKLLKMKG